MTSRRSKFENENFVRSEFFQIFIPDDHKEIQVRRRDCPKSENIGTPFSAFIVEKMLILGGGLGGGAPQKILGFYDVKQPDFHEILA